MEWCSAVITIALMSIFATGNQNDYSYTYGLINVNFPCMSGMQFKSDGSNQYVSITTGYNGIEIDGNVVELPSLNSTHEGVYSCAAVDPPTIYNLTVLGIAFFVGCDKPINAVLELNCNLGFSDTYTQGSDIVFNISFAFYGGGSRGGKQEIKKVFIFIPSSSQKVVSCTKGRNCNTDKNSVISQRTIFSYSGLYNIQMLIANATDADSGVYEFKALVESNHITTTFTSSRTINVTTPHPTVLSTTSEESVPYSTVSLLVTSSNSQYVYTRITSSNLVQSTVSPLSTSPSSTTFLSASDSTTTSISNSPVYNKPLTGDMQTTTIVIAVFLSVLGIVIVSIVAVALCMICRKYYKEIVEFDDFARSVKFCDFISKKHKSNSTDKLSLASKKCNGISITLSQEHNSKSFPV